MLATCIHILCQACESEYCRCGCCLVRAYRPAETALLAATSLCEKTCGQSMCCRCMRDSNSPAFAGAVARMDSLSSRQGAASRYCTSEKWTSPAVPPCCSVSTTCSHDQLSTQTQPQLLRDFVPAASLHSACSSCHTMLQLANAQWYQADLSRRSCSASRCQLAGRLQCKASSSKEPCLHDRLTGHR